MENPHKRLKAFRLSKQLSKVALARLLGCDDSYLTHVEAGRRRLGLDFAVPLEVLSRKWSEGPIRAAEWLRKRAAA